MKRKIVLFLVIALLAIGVFTAPAPVAQGQSDRCQLARKECYSLWFDTYFTFCYELTGDLNRCNKESNAGYKSCVGDCWSTP